MWLAYILLRLALDPIAAGHFAAAASGRPDLGPVLEEICRRESGCTIVGHHPTDAHRSAAVWSGAVRMRALTPRTCPWHRFGAGPWSTSGPWGMMRGYTMPYLGCAPVWALDLPLLGAFVAVVRMTHPRCLRTRGCARWAGLG